MTKREIIEPNPGDKRYARRDDKGHFTSDQTDVGKPGDQAGKHLSRKQAVERIVQGQFMYARHLGPP